MKKTLFLLLVVSALSVYIGMEVQRRKATPSSATSANMGTAPRPSGAGGTGNAQGGSTSAQGVTQSSQMGTSSAQGGTNSAQIPRASGAEAGKTAGPNPYGSTSGMTSRTKGEGGQRSSGAPASQPPSPQASVTSAPPVATAPPAVAEGSAGQTSRRGGIPVEVAPVRWGEIRRVGVFNGTLEARSQFVLSTKIAGRLKSVLVDVGDEIKKGQLIALLEEEDYRYPYEQALADLEAAKANLEDAQGALEIASREYERAKSLHASRVISAVELDTALNQFRRADASVKVLQAQVRQREAALSIARDRLEATRIVANWESEESVRVVGERFVTPGALLRANDSICSLLDLSSVVGVINVTELDYPLVQLGQRAMVRAEVFPNRTFIGRVERISPFLQPSTRQASVRIAIPNRGRELKPGMFIQAEVEYERKSQALLLPEVSLVTRNEQTGVFLVKPQEGKVQFVPVQVGIREGGRVEILSPALSGQVVIAGQHLLQDGSAVIVVGTRS
ncbi:MAG: efflux RND transporter periplasmic adaptor subunit [Spirochaetales bacterium]